MARAVNVGPGDIDDPGQGIIAKRIELLEVTEKGVDAPS
jgi:hypothetical protein